MGEGVRIEVRPDAGIPPGPHLIIVRDHDRPVRRPAGVDNLDDVLDECVLCKKANNGPARHYVKTYHIQLDADATAIVSAGVWAGLQNCASQPFQVRNIVADPPTVHLLLPPPSLVNAGARP